MGADRNRISKALHAGRGRLPMSDCSVKPAKDKPAIQDNGHLRVISAVQPFSTEAISRAVSVPTERTSEGIAERFTPRAGARISWPSRSAVTVESESNGRARRSRRKV